MKKIILVCILFTVTCPFANSQWQQTFGIPTAPIYCIASSGSNMYAGITFANENGVYFSTNSGLNWTGIGLIHRTVNSIAIINGNVFAGTDTGVYLTTNNGINWTYVNYGLAFRNVKAITSLGTDLYAGSNGIWKSTNNGTLWFQTPLINHSMSTFLVAGNTIFAGTSLDGVYISANNGLTWNFMNLNNRLIYSIALLGTNVFVGTEIYGIYRTTNYGVSWEQMNNGLTVLNSYSLAVSGQNIFSGYDGVYLSTNNGLNWVPKNDGFGLPHFVNCLLNANGYLYAGTTYIGIWRRPLTEFIGIKKISTSVPENFSLQQNYPNPFNPSTNIKFQIKKFSEVNISVYDITGQIVENIVNEKILPGIYEVKWNASSFSSGMYFCKLTASEYTKTIKMNLIK